MKKVIYLFAALVAFVSFNACTVSPSEQPVNQDSTTVNTDTTAAVDTTQNPASEADSTVSPELAK